MPDTPESAQGPLATVCIPTIGGMVYLERVFRSLREQTHHPVETIVLDNGSPPDVQALIRAFAASRPDTHILRSDERLPMFANFNRGVRAAKGKYLAFFHDDDEYVPTFLSRLVELLEANPSAVFAGGNFDVIDGEGGLLWRNRLIPRTEVWEGRRFISEVTKRGRSPVPTPGLLFRTDAFRVEGFDESLPMNWGDFPILMRLAERGEVAVHVDPLYSWRVHNANASHLAPKVSIPLRTRVLLAYCDEFAVRHPAEAQFASRLRAYAERTHWKGLLWGWISALSDDDARDCRRMLRDSQQGRPISVLLQALEFLGLSRSRRIALVPALRSVAQGAIGWMALIRPVRRIQP